MRNLFIFWVLMDAKIYRLKLLELFICHACKFLKFADLFLLPPIKWITPFPYIVRKISSWMVLTIVHHIYILYFSKSFACLLHKLWQRVWYTFSRYQNNRMCYKCYDLVLVLDMLLWISSFLSQFPSLLKEKTPLVMSKFHRSV